MATSLRKKSIDPRPPRSKPELLFLGSAPSACDCRVCGRPIALAQVSWGWRWRSTARGHLGCGWYTLADGEAMSALRCLGNLRSMPSPRARERAHELFIMQCKDFNGDKVWSISPIGIALLRLVRASESTPSGTPHTPPEGETGGVDSGVRAKEGP